MVILLLLWRAEGYHQSAVGHLSPFIHECRTYYLNSRLNDADAAAALDTLGAVAKATPTMTGDLHISKDSGGLIALDHAPGQIAYIYGHDGTKRTFFLGVADTDGTVQISNADGVYLNLYPTHAAFSHDLHVTGGESPNSAVRQAYADALSYDGSGNTVDVGFSAMMVGNGWTLNETVAGSAVTLAYLEANDISAEAFLGGATSSALRVGTWKARHSIGSTGKQIAVPGERIL